MITLLIGGLGPMELGIVLAIVILIFGAGKLPQVGDALGRGLSNFKRASRATDADEPAPSTRQAHLPPASTTEPVSPGARRATEPSRTAD